MTMPDDDRDRPSSPGSDRARWTVSATLESVGSTRRDVNKWLLLVGASKAIRDAAGLVVSELLTNAVRATADPQGRIRLALNKQPAGWEVTVADRGHGFPARPRQQQLTAGDPLPVTGRGLLVVDRLAGPVSVQRRAAGWTVVKALIRAPRKDSTTQQGVVTRSAGSDR
jgi:anti-sigma regulatory factor (Ser/Thr protein kinase)